MNVLERNEMRLVNEEETFEGGEKPSKQKNKMKEEGEEREESSPLRVIFSGEVARRIRKLEKDLRGRLSKPDLGKVLGNEILSWNEKHWSDLVEENTDLDYFFAEIRNHTDRGESIKLLKSMAEKLKNKKKEASSLEEKTEENLYEAHFRSGT